MVRVGSFGERLRREREMRGITLEEIAEATKIGTRSLRALEQEQFEILPGGIFNKGFVRAYARFLGIDEEQAVADYLGVAREDEPPLPAAFCPTPELVGGEAEPGGDRSERVVLAWGAVAAVLVAVALIIIGLYGYRRWKGERETIAPVMSSTAVPAQPPLSAPQADKPAVAGEAALKQPLATDSPAANSQPAPPEMKSMESSAQPTSKRRPSVAPITLHIRARTAAWLEITADDKIVMSAILPAASEKTIRADKRVVLDIGNAGGVEITHNGKPLGPVGPEGKRKIVTFTPEGVRD